MAAVSVQRTSRVLAERACGVHSSSCVHCQLGENSSHFLCRAVRFNGGGRECLLKIMANHLMESVTFLQQ